MLIDSEIISYLLEKIGIINSEMGAIQVDVGVLKSQVGELIWTQRAVLLVIIGFIVTRVLLLVINKKNNK